MSGIETINTVRLTVQAIAEGKIHVKPPNPATPTSKLRFAPNFRLGITTESQCRAHAYTVESLRPILRGKMTVKDTQYALRCLALIEGGYLQDKQLSRLSWRQVRTVVDMAQQAIKSACVGQQDEKKGSCRKNRSGRHGGF